MNIEELFQLVSEKKASDLLLSAGSPVTIKVHGVLLAINQNNILSNENIINILSTIISETQLSELLLMHDLNVAVRRGGVGRFRMSAFKQRGDISAVFRYIPIEPPSLDFLNIPAFVGDLINEPRGLVLICGATGSGKSTTIASMIESRNQNKGGHILSIEEPIEYYFKPKKSIINQREIGSDAPTMAVALKNALRQAPDLLFIGEIRDQAAMTAAITYALSGHLVISTLHANNSYHALSRIVSMYPADSRDNLLSDLSACLRSVVSQRLVKALMGGRLPAIEVLVNTQLTADLIEQGKLAEIKDAMNRSLAKGSQTFEQHLMHYVNNDLVALEEAMQNADSPTNLTWLLNNQGNSPADPNSEVAIDRSAKGATYQEFDFK
jgi:twitching motility protein PilU